MSRVQQTFTTPPPPVCFRLIPLLLLLLFAACGGNSPSDDVTGNGGTVTPPDPYITMTSDKTLVTLYLAGSGTATIDWGGVLTETVTLEAGNQEFESPTMTAPAAIKITVPGGGLTWLDCGGQGLTTLDISRMTRLTWLNCSNNDTTLTSLDLTKNTALTYLDCSYDYSLASLDLSKNTKLEELSMWGMKRTALDVSHNPALTRLDCDDNDLESLNVSANTKLETIRCSYNEMDAAALNALFTSLHNNTIPEVTKEINVAGNPGSDTCDASIAEGKGWDVTTAQE